MSLTEEIAQKSKEITVSSYPMSVGELASMYRDGDLDIHPEFQRFYRWTDSQKTALIESLLLNIPVPPLYMAQLENGIWEVVDGLQRVSTILQFMGIYKNEEGEIQPPLELLKTRFLPSLAGKYFNSDDEEKSFTIEEQRFFKRAKIDLVILKQNSDPPTKYELFQRLNTGGTSLSEQELRNCIIVSENPDVYRKLNQAALQESFRSIISLNESDIEQRMDMELLCRFLVLRNDNFERFKEYSDFGLYISDRIRELIKDPEWDVDHELEIFSKTCEYLNSSLHEKAFQRYYPGNDAHPGRFKGGMLMGAFEMVAITLGRKNGETALSAEEIEHRLKDFWSQRTKRVEWTGVNAFVRVKIAIELGENLYGE